MKACFLVFLSVISISTLAQSVDSEASKANIGFGIGVDYGGFGGRITYQATPGFGVFAGLGYNLAGAGFNAGGMVRFSPEKRVVPCLYAMYGYNSVLKITGSIEVNKTYYGPSFGGGLQIRSKNNSMNFWNVELLVPVRPSEFEADQNYYKSQGVELSSPLPVSFSIGYHIGL